MLKNKSGILNLGLCILSLIFFSHAYGLNIDALKSYFLKGDYALCIKEAEKILADSGEKDKNRDELYYLLGLSYLKENSPLAAGYNFKIILNQYKNNRFQEEALMGLGDCYFLRGDYTIAAFQYQELLDKNPKTRLKAGIYLRFAQLGAKTANQEQEKEYLARLKNEYPFSPEANFKGDLFPQGAAIELSRNPSMEHIADSTISYSIQVGAFSSNINAAKLARKLQKNGYEVHIEQASSAGKSIYKVRIGNISNRQKARELERKLQADGYPTKIIP
jgi:tetratricopeptide (TPR) repeat protein